MPKTYIEAKRVNRLYDDLHQCPEISEVKWFDLENAKDILIRIERDTVVTIHLFETADPKLLYVVLAGIGPGQSAISSIVLAHCMTEPSPTLCGVAEAVLQKCWGIVSFFESKKSRDLNLAKLLKHFDSQ